MEIVLDRTPFYAESGGQVPIAAPMQLPATFGKAYVLLHSESPLPEPIILPMLLYVHASSSIMVHKQGDKAAP